jgi:DNA repair exonuclease SbcCD ATPase subunit
MITLKTLTWSNLFSYGADNTISLSEEPITQLVGLNGHGKSSIPLVLEEVLFNKNSKGIKKGDVVNRQLNTTKYSGICTFSIFDKDYQMSIDRSGASQKVKLIENGVDISSHTATATFAQLEDLFGVDAKTFSQLVYQNSGSSLQFLTATDSNRKKFLIDLLSLDRYINIFERVKVAHKEIADKLLQLGSKEATVRSWLETAGKTVLTEIALATVPSLDSTKATQLGALKAQLAEINSINSKISDNNLYKKKISSIDSSALVSTKTTIFTKDLEQQRAEVQLELKQYATIIKKYSGLHVGECPTCTQPIDTDKIRYIIDDATTLAEIKKAAEKRILEEIAVAEANNKEVSAHQALVKEFEQLSILIDMSLPELTLDKEELDTKITELQEYITSINDSIAKVTKFNNVASATNAKVAAIKEQLENYTSELELISVDISKLEKSFSVLEVLKKAFSTTGLIAYKIENSVKELEALTNEYLAELSDGRFELLFVLEKDKLNIVIVDNGKEIEITALSAGELARVTTSTLLAIRKLMSSLSKSRINILFLDEVIDVLDTYGKEKLIEVLLKEDGLNTFLISHSYSHPLVKRLEVIKEEGISRLNYNGS